MCWRHWGREGRKQGLLRREEGEMEGARNGGREGGRETLCRRVLVWEGEERIRCENGRHCTKRKKKEVGGKGVMCECH